MTEAWEEEAELMLHGQPYTVSVSVRGDELDVSCELATSGDRWKATFAAACACATRRTCSPAPLRVQRPRPLACVPMPYVMQRFATFASCLTDVEEITHKTGSFKRFSVFAQMVRSAVSGASDSLSLDILTAADLELLKSKRLRAPPTDGAPPPAASSKRYLIITYVAEYDRVHYPLPLAFEVAPSAEQMRAQLRELRAEVDALRRGGGKAPADVTRLERENAELRARLEKRTAEARAAERRLASVAELEQSHAQLRRHSAQLEEALEAMRREASREVKAIKRECARIASEQGEEGSGHGRAEAQAALCAEQEARAELAAELKALKKKLRALEADASARGEAHARQLRRALRERDAALLDAQRCREGESAARLRLRAASSELAWLKTKGAPAAGGGARGSAPRGVPAGASRTPVGSRASSRAPSRSGSAGGARSRDPSPGASSRASSSALRSPSPRQPSAHAGARRAGSAPASRAPSRPVSPHLYQPRHVARPAQERASPPSIGKGRAPPARSAPSSRPSSAERARWREQPPSSPLSSPSPLGSRVLASARERGVPSSAFGRSIASPTASRHAGRGSAAPSAAAASSSSAYWQGGSGGLSPRPYDRARAGGEASRGKPPAPRPPPRPSAHGFGGGAGEAGGRADGGRTAHKVVRPHSAALLSESDGESEDGRPPVRVPSAMGALLSSSRLLGAAASERHAAAGSRASSRTGSAHGSVGGGARAQPAGAYDESSASSSDSEPELLARARAQRAGDQLKENGAAALNRSGANGKEEAAPVCAPRHARGRLPAHAPLTRALPCRSACDCAMPCRAPLPLQMRPWVRRRGRPPRAWTSRTSTHACPRCRTSCARQRR